MRIRETELTSSEWPPITSPFSSVSDFMSRATGWSRTEAHWSELMQIWGETRNPRRRNRIFRYTENILGNPLPPPPTMQWTNICIPGNRGRKNIRRLFDISRFLIFSSSFSKHLLSTSSVTFSRRDFFLFHSKKGERMCRSLKLGIRIRKISSKQRISICNFPLNLLQIPPHYPCYYCKTIHHPRRVAVVSERRHPVVSSACHIWTSEIDTLPGGDQETVTRNRRRRMLMRKENMWIRDPPSLRTNLFSSCPLLTFDSASLPDEEEIIRSVSVVLVNGTLRDAKQRFLVEEEESEKNFPISCLWLTTVVPNVATTKRPATAQLRHPEMTGWSWWCFVDGSATSVHR